MCLVLTKSAPSHFVVNVQKSIVLNVLTHTAVWTKVCVKHNMSCLLCNLH